MDVVWQGIQGLWNGILDFTARLVIPDWAGLILLLPILLAAIVGLFFAWLAVRWASAGPKRRGMGRRPPVPPPGVHAGTPSAAPLFAAVGAFLLVVTLVVRGPFLVIGPAVLVLALLYWGREALREYEHLEPVAAGTNILPAVVRQPPEGVHMPGPSFLPLLGALGALALFSGLLLKGAMLIAGLVVLVILLSGWMSAARTEWAATAEADRTGHVATGPRPRMPVKRLALSAVILVVAALVNAGYFSVTGGGAGAGGAAAGASPGASPGPGQASASAGPAADVTIVAHNIAYTTATADAPAGKPFTLAFDNEDQGVPHDVTIHEASPTGRTLFDGEVFPGVKTVVYNVPALPAGTYAYVCSVHPNMTGTLTVK